MTRLNAPRSGAVEASECTISHPRPRRQPGQVLLLAPDPLDAARGVHRHDDPLRHAAEVPAASRFTNSVSAQIVDARRGAGSLPRGRLHPAGLAGDEEDEVEADVEHQPASDALIDVPGAPAAASHEKRRPVRGRQAAAAARPAPTSIAPAAPSGSSGSKKYGTLAADLAQHRQVRARDRDAAPHRLEHRQAEALGARRERRARRHLPERLELVGGHVVREDHALRRRPASAASERSSRS